LVLGLLACCPPTSKTSTSVVARSAARGVISPFLAPSGPLDETPREIDARGLPYAE
jgi:hypothetical protein